MFTLWMCLSAVCVCLLACSLAHSSMCTVSMEGCTGMVKKSFLFRVCWHLGKISCAGLRLALEASDRRVGMVQSVCEDATGGGGQIGNLLWDMVGSRNLLLPLVSVWEARRQQRQGAV